MKRLLGVSALLVATTGQASNLTPVKIVVLEALAPRDTTSSETFKKEFQSTLDLGFNLLQSKLAKCGYAVTTEFRPFDANDPLQAFEEAKRAEAQSAWMIVGPRRSNHYLLVAKGAPDTPAVSIMASSSEVQALGSRFRTLYPFNDALAKAAAKVTSTLETKVGGKTYFSVVSEDCVSCRDFADHFDKEAKRLRLTKLGQALVSGDNPQTLPVVAAVLNAKPAFVLLPNYSKVSALLMGAINEKMPQVRFIGGDGWGDQKFGFVERNPIVRESPGITVRGFPPVAEGLKAFPLGIETLKGERAGRFMPSSGPGLALLKTLEGVSNALCEAKSKDRASFRQAFEAKGDRWFKSPWGISAYKVQAGAISYWKKVK